MKKVFLVVLCFFCIISSVMAKNTKFIDGLEDVPLMKGLEQNIDNTISFGNEEARFIEVFLHSSKIGFKKVESFYKESLPQLGWIYQGTYNNAVIFYREGESLSIIKEDAKPLKIRITLKNRI